MKNVILGFFILANTFFVKAYELNSTSFIHEFTGTSLNTDDFTWSTEPDYLPITLEQDDSLIISNTGTQWEKINLNFTDSIDISANPYIQILARSTVDNAYKLQLLDTEGGSTYSQFSVDFIGDSVYHTYTINVSESWANLEKINQLKLLYGDQETNSGEIIIKKLTMGVAPESGNIDISTPLPTDKPRVIVGKKTSYGYTVLTRDSSLLRGNAVWLWRAKLINKPSELQYAFEEEYYQMLADSGVNFIRLCIYTQSNDWGGGTNYNDPEEVKYLLERTDSVVNFASKYGMHVLLNYHDVGKYTGEYSDGDAETMGYLKDFWKVFAPHYKDRTHVFYEPVNEPAFGSSNFKGALLDSMYVIYDYIKKLAPETHQSLLCITAAVSKSWDSQSMEDVVNRFVAQYGDSVDWAKASIAFHPYTSTEKVYSSEPIQNVMENYAVINTEANYPCKESVHDQVLDADKQCQTVDGEVFINETMERLGISWNMHKSLGWDHFSSNFSLLLKDAREKGYIWFGDFTEYTINKSANNGYITPRHDKLRYEEDTPLVTFEAIPDAGFLFANWSGDTVSPVNPIDLLLKDTIIYLTANFEAIPSYVITVIGSDNGRVYLTPNKSEYYKGDTVRINAFADDGYEFAGWEQEFLDDTATVYIVVNEDITITAIFESITAVDEISTFAPIKVWPNPVLDELNIIMKGDGNEVARLTIYDLKGKLVYFDRVTRGKLTIDKHLINDGNPGVLLLQIETSNDIFTEKIVFF